MKGKLISASRDIFKPKDVRYALEITNETLRYWRDKLDPRRSKSRFTDRDLYSYGIIKSFCHNRYIPVKKLIQYDWKPIFDLCHAMTKQRLQNYVVYIDRTENNLGYASSINTIDTTSTDITFITIESVIKLINGNLFPGERIDNVIDISQNPKFA